MLVSSSQGGMLFGLVVWAHFLWLAQAQSTLSAAAITTASALKPAVAASTPAASTAKPYLAIRNIDTWIACGIGQIYWSLNNEDPSRYNITLYAISADNQDIPVSDLDAIAPNLLTSQTATSTRSTSEAAVSKVIATQSRQVLRSLAPRTTLNINQTIVTQYANHGYGWNPIKLPQGRYYIYGYVDDNLGISDKSNIFSVVEGANTSCLATFQSISKTASGIQTLSNSGKPQSAGDTSIESGASSNGNTSKDNAGGIGGGAIAGIVIGALFGSVVLVILAFFCIRRRRQVARCQFRDDHQMGMTHRRMVSGSSAPSNSGHSLDGAVFGQERNGTVGIVHGDSFRSIESKSSETTVGKEREVVGPALKSEYEEGQEILRGDDPFHMAILPHSPGASAMPSMYAQPTSHIYPSALTSREDRRASNPISPSTHSSSSLSRNSRSFSQPNQPNLMRRPSLGTAEPLPNNNHDASQLGRTPSSRRKPVPSLGPELRGELTRQASLKGREEGAKVVGPLTLSQKSSSASLSLGVGGSGGEKRMSFQLIPDPPLNPE
ncbi:hypothetical protein L204_104251 [Cryptococcus depauperatus]|nr:hypothetical protein L204_04924 [Cryptococcus depauperatus CBS 7855]